MKLAKESGCFIVSPHWITAVSLHLSSLIAYHQDYSKKVLYDVDVVDIFSAQSVDPEYMNLIILTHTTPTWHW